MNIQILLSTYNGERYLRSQLDSFLTLEGVKVSVLIRDDGSSDTTRDILCEYRDKYGFSVIFGENIGLNRSMFELVKHRDISADFYAFADQDDVWLPSKLALAAEKLSGIEGAALYAGTSYLTDEELNITGSTKGIRRPLGFYNAMVENVCIGHTMVLNRELMDIYADHYSDGIFVFDYWAFLICATFGKVVFDTTPTALYRQHSENAIGYKSSGLSRLLVRIRRVFVGKSYYNARQLYALLSSFGASVPDEYRNEALSFFAHQRNFFTRLAYIFKTKAYRQGRCEGIIFRMMYLFGRYNVDQDITEGQAPGEEIKQDSTDTPGMGHF